MDEVPEFKTRTSTDGSDYRYVVLPPIEGGAGVEPLWQTIWGNLTGEGGLLRVRAGLALGLTGGGIGYLLANNVMPPEAYNVIWVGALGYYFGTRGNS